MDVYINAHGERVRERLMNVHMCVVLCKIIDGLGKMMQRQPTPSASHPDAQRRERRDGDHGPHLLEQLAVTKYPPPARPRDSELDLPL